MGLPDHYNALWGWGHHVIRTFLKHNQIFGFEEKKEHFEVAFELYLGYIISILINDGAEMLVNFDLIETKVIVFKGTRVN